MKQIVRKALQSAGYDIHRYSVQQSPRAQIAKILEFLGIDLVLDVGANEGQYGATLRDAGYCGQILSFEPLESAHRVLVSRTHGDPNWSVGPPVAAGAESSSAFLKVSKHSLSSSLLAMLPAHLEAAPGSETERSEAVQVRRLDEMAAAAVLTAQSTWLKIDTQGYEHHVLEGAAGLIDQIAAIQMELSLVSLYEGQLLWDEMRGILSEKSFELYAILPGYVHPGTGRTMQIDGVFVRKTV